jgi:hypothetical protein
MGVRDLGVIAMTVLTIQGRELREAELTADQLATVNLGDGGHWYTEGGRLVTAVRMADGSWRRPHLGDARKFQLAPGVTTITGCAVAHQLEKWKRKKTALVTERLPRQDGESDDDYAKRVEAARAEEAQAAPDEGTRIHAAIESHYKRESYDERYKPHVDGVANLIDDACGDQLWVPEREIVHPFGYATKADLCSSNASEQRWLIDFKSKDGTLFELVELSTYEPQWMQLAATREAMEPMSSRRCAICYVSRTEPGVAVFCEVTEKMLEIGWKCFASLLCYWQASKDYRPDWATELHVMAAQRSDP